MINLTIDEALKSQAAPELKDEATLSQAVLETLRSAGAPSGSALTVVITSDEQLAMLNQQYLGVQSPTDVLSFPADEVDPDSGERYLGDVLISHPRAQAQAAAGGHAVIDELQLLIVHGVLHLLGYDHAGEMDKAEMWSIQADVLHQLGCAVTVPSP